MYIPVVAGGRESTRGHMPGPPWQVRRCAVDPTEPGKVQPQWVHELLVCLPSVLAALSHHIIIMFFYIYFYIKKSIMKIKVN